MEQHNLIDETKILLSRGIIQDKPIKYRRHYPFSQDIKDLKDGNTVKICSGTSTKYVNINNYNPNGHMINSASLSDHSIRDHIENIITHLTNYQNMVSHMRCKNIIEPWSRSINTGIFAESQFIKYNGDFYDLKDINKAYLINITPTVPALLFYRNGSIKPKIANSYIVAVNKKGVVNIFFSLNPSFETGLITKYNATEQNPKLHNIVRNYMDSRITDTMFIGNSKYIITDLNDTPQSIEIAPGLFMNPFALVGSVSVSLNGNSVENISSGSEQNSKILSLTEKYSDILS